MKLYCLLEPYYGNWNVRSICAPFVPVHAVSQSNRRISPVCTSSFDVLITAAVVASALSNSFASIDTPVESISTVVRAVAEDLRDRLTWKSGAPEEDTVET